MFLSATRKHKAIPCSGRALKLRPPVMFQRDYKFPLQVKRREVSCELLHSHCVERHVEREKIYANIRCCAYSPIFRTIYYRITENRSFKRDAIRSYCIRLNIIVKLRD